MENKRIDPLRFKVLFIISALVVGFIITNEIIDQKMEEYKDMPTPDTKDLWKYRRFRKVIINKKEIFIHLFSKLFAKNSINSI